MEVRNGACGHGQVCALKQLPCNRDTKTRTKTYPAPPYLLLQQGSSAASLRPHKMAASSGCLCPSTEGEPGPLSSQVLSQPPSTPCHHPGQRLSLRGAAQGAFSQGTAQEAPIPSSHSAGPTASQGCTSPHKAWPPGLCHTRQSSLAAPAHFSPQTQV